MNSSFGNEPRTSREIFYKKHGKPDLSSRYFMLVPIMVVAVLFIGLALFNAQIKPMTENTRPLYTGEHRPAQETLDPPERLQMLLEIPPEELLGPLPEYRSEEQSEPVQIPVLEEPEDWAEASRPNPTPMDPVTFPFDE